MSIYHTKRLVFKTFMETLMLLHVLLQKENLYDLKIITKHIG